MSSLLRTVVFVALAVGLTVTGIVIGRKFPGAGGTDGNKDSNWRDEVKPPDLTLVQGGGVEAVVLCDYDRGSPRGGRISVV